MADLGNLWFSLGLDDSKFKKEWDIAFKKYQKDAKINLDIDISKSTIESLKALKDMGFNNKQWSAMTKAATAAGKYMAQMQKVETQVAKTKVEEEKRNRELAKTIALQEESKARIVRQDKESDARVNRQNEESLKRQELIKARINNQDKQRLGTNKKIKQSFHDQALWVQNIQTLFSNYMSVYAVRNFVSELARVSGEFEIQRKTLQAMVGEFEGSQIYSQIKGLSVVSPFQFKDLAGYTKQLAAFSVPYNELYETTKSLADISAGLGVDMSRIVLAFGQIRSSQVLKGTELRQLTEAGVPILEELANKFTQLEGRAVSVGEVFGKISQKLVPFEMVKEIFADLTSEGGKFYRMQEIQAETLAGKISNLTDAYQIMLSELGESNEGLLKSGVDFLYKLIDNYETLVAVLKTVTFAFTTYQTAQVLAFAVDKLTIIGKFVVIMKRLHFNIINAARAMNMLNIASKANVWGALASVLVGVGAALIVATRNANRFNRELDKMLSADISKLRDEKYALEELKKATEDAAIGSLNRKDAIDKINSRFGEYLDNMLTEKSTAEDVAAAYDRITVAMQNKYKQESLEKAKTKVNEDFGKDIEDRLSKIITSLNKDGFDVKTAGKVAGRIRSEIEKNADITFNEVIEKIKERFGEEISDSVRNALIPAMLKGPYENLAPDDSRKFDKLSDAIRAYSDAMDIAIAKNDAFYGEDAYNTKSEADFIEKLNEKYAKLEDQIRSNARVINGEIIPAEQRQGELIALEIKKLQELSEAYANPEFLNNPAKAKELEKQWMGMIQHTTEWEKAIRQITKDNQSAFEFNPLQNEQLPDYLKRLQERYEDLLSTKRLLDTKINKGEDIVGSKKDLDIIEEKLIEIKQVAASINFNLVDKDAQKEKDRFKKLEELLQNYKNKLTQFYTDIELKASELEVSMSDISLDNIGQGDFAQQLNKINQEFEKGQLSIEKYKNKLIKAWREIKEAEYKSKGQVFTGDITLDMLPQQAQKVISAYEAVIAKKKEFDSAMLNQSVVDEFATLEQKRTNVIDEYLKKLSVVTKMDFKHLNINPLELFFPNGIPYNNILEELSKIDLSKVKFTQGFDLSAWFSELATELWSIEKDLSPIYEQIFGNLQTMTKTQILQAIQLAKNLLKNADLTDVQQAEIREQISRLQKAYEDAEITINATLDPVAFIGQIKNYTTLAEKADELKTEEEKRAEALAKEQVITSGIAIAVNTMAQGLNTASEAMKKLAEYSDDVHLADTAEQIGAVAQNLSAAAQGAASGGWIGAIIGGATDLISQLIGGITQSKVAYAQLQLYFKEWRREIELLKYSTNEDDYDTIFGTNSISKVQDAILNAKGALNSYIKEANSAELRGLRVKTTNYSGLEQLFGRKNNYQRLEDFAPELWGEDGNFNIEAAKRFLEVNQNITEAQREQIQAAIDLYEVYEENMSIINDYLSGIFSDTANTIAQQMMSAFARTGDAAFELGDIVNNVANNMAQDIIQALLIDQYLKPAMDKIKGLYDATSDEYEGNAYARTQKAIQAMQEGLAAAQLAVPEVNALLEALEATGIDIKGDSENASQVLSGLTEDQQNLLLSYINAIRADVSINKGIMTTIANYTGSINNNIATALIVWKQIEANTHRSADGVDRIVGIIESVISAYDGGSGQAFKVNIA